jgi:cell division protein FtsQ
MKKFWNIFKKVMLLLSALALVVVFVFTLTSAVQHRQSLVCSSVQVRIDYESGVDFLSTDDIISRVNESIDDNIVGKPLSSLDLKAIEQYLEQNPFVDQARVYTDHAQILHAEIVQKQPILRVMNNDGVGYYLSDKNEKIPLSDKFTARVPIAMGVVETHEDSYGDSIVLYQLYQWAQYLQRDSLIGALIDHCYVQESGELELYPKFGYHTILFGRADGTMAEKFEKLKTFYKEGMTRVGWDKYSTINLKYKGQVVCERRGEEATIKRPEPPAQDTTTNNEQPIDEQ